MSKNECENCKKLQEKLDGLIAVLDVDCVYCGQSIVRSIKSDLVKEED